MLWRIYVIKYSDSEKAMERVFSPEFRNRLDAVISFSDLDADVILHIVDKFIQELKKQLVQKGISCSVEEEVKSYQGMVMFAHDEESTVRQIVFELRNGERVASKLVDKIDGRWKLADQWS